MRSRILCAAVSLAALSTLGACNQQAENSSANNAAAAAAPVVLPPPVQSTKVYRCADNSLAYVDFYGNGTATISATRGGASTSLTGTGPDGPYSGTGYTLSGNGDAVRIAQPGKPEQRCHT